MAEDAWHPEAADSVSAGDGEFVINLVKNGQVQKSPYCTDTSLSSACVPLPPPCTTSAWLSPKLLLSSLLLLQAQYSAVSPDSTLGQESSYLVNSVPRAPGMSQGVTISERQRPSLCGSRALGIVPRSGPSETRSLHLDLLTVPRKHHPGPLLNKFPGPTADPLRQHVQGPGEPHVKCALEILPSPFGKCRPNSAFTNVEPRPGAGGLSGSPRNRELPAAQFRHDLPAARSESSTCS